MVGGALIWQCEDVSLREGVCVQMCGVCVCKIVGDIYMNNLTKEGQKHKAKNHK